MEINKETVIRILGTVIIIGLLTIISIRKPHNVAPQPLTYNACKEDSLREVISNLQSEMEIAEDGWDKKEQRYEDILFEYEYGIDHLKHHHINAYKDFHRIIGFKERYSRETETENKKRLND